MRRSAVDLQRNPIPWLRADAVPILVAVAADRIIVDRREANRLGSRAVRKQRRAGLHKNRFEVLDLDDRARIDCERHAALHRYVILDNDQPAPRRILSDRTGHDKNVRERKRGKIAINRYLAGHAVAALVEQIAAQVRNVRTEDHFI